MAKGSETDLSPAQRRELDGHLRKVWALGANLIIGWRLRPFGIEVLYLPSYGLPRVAKNQPNLLRLDRYLKTDEQYDNLIRAGCKARSLRLLFEIRQRGSTLAAVNSMIRNYTVTHFSCRAVALFDIVSFSIHSPFEQITQISVLSHYIKLAARRCRSLGMPVALCMSTTGDGFYIWNRHEGLPADIALYNVVMLALGYNSAARRMAETESVPRLRCAVHFGSHYEYYQGGGERAEENAFIVGDVTINLARIISRARTSQLLIGGYIRNLIRGERQWAEKLGISIIDTPSFMALAQGETRKLVGLPIPGGRIEEMRVYLTGAKISDDTYSIRKYYITDKHGLEHPCYNARLTIRSSSGATVSFGHLDRDLDKFQARSDENEDILIKMR